MNLFDINPIAVALGIVLSTGAMAQGIPKNEYQAGKDKIVAEVRLVKARCTSLSGNANDICMAVAAGQEMVARAELEASYKPSPRASYKVRVAKAEANYAEANERCDDKSGNVKDVCVMEAKSAKTAAEADAEAQLKTTNANVTASEKSAEARSDANSKASKARQDATADKIDAEYAVSKEKCDTFAGDAKDRCLDQAKAQFVKK